MRDRESFSAIEVLSPDAHVDYPGAARLIGPQGILGDGPPEDNSSLAVNQ